MTRPLRVGVADSGINPRDPQAGGVAGGVGIHFRDGRIERNDAWADLLGHGTAVAATIRGHAPGCALYAVRIFQRGLEARVETLLSAIEWAASEKLDLLNLSVGCQSLDRESEFIGVCRAASAAGVVIVAAAEVDGKPSLPGKLPGIVAVRADFSLEPAELRLEGAVFLASPWARTRGELPREKNFHGTSFAVANVTGLAARLLDETESTVRSVRDLLVDRAGKSRAGQ